MMVRNDVRATTQALVKDLNLQSAGDVAVTALEQSGIAARLSGEVGASSSSLLGLAKNSLIATNLVLNRVEAAITGSRLYVEGSLDVAADNLVRISAINRAVMQGSGVSAGVSMAFNAVGWDAREVLSGSLEAMLLGQSQGTEVGDQTIARVVNSDVTVLGRMSVLSGLAGDPRQSLSTGLIEARVQRTNTSALPSASASFIVASNQISSRSLAWVGTEATPEAAAALVQEPAKLARLQVGAQLEVLAIDAPTIASDITLKISGGGGASAGGIAARNEVRSEVDAGLDRLRMDLGAQLSVQAVELAVIRANLSGLTQSLSQADASVAEKAVSVIADALYPPIAINGLIANNVVLGGARAGITRSDLAAAGSVTIEANNTASIEADNQAVMSSGGTAVGVTLAFNTIGWLPETLLKQGTDALVGSGFGVEAPQEVKAWMLDTAFSIGGNFSVQA
jgi:hypothetical protein